MRRPHPVPGPAASRTLPGAPSLSEAPCAVGRLNIFQQLIRRWEQVHPYNAAQVLRLAGRADFQRLDDAWDSAVRALGLGIARVEDGHYWFEPPPGESHRLCVYRVQGLSLEEHLSAELNRPCVDGQGLPFRSFVIQDPDSYCAGVVYQHWTADSTAMRILLREWFMRITQPDAARRTPVHLPSGGYWRYFGPDQVPWRIPDALLSFPRWLSRFRRVRKIRTGGSNNYDTGFALRRAEDGWIDALRNVSHRLGVTVNDLFLAATAHACHRHLPLVRHARRQDLAIGTIIDLRRHGHHDLTDTFGLFLGFGNVICRPNDLADLKRLIRTVSAQTAMQKRTASAPASMLWLAAATGVMALMRLDKTFPYYRKHFPLCGGISNVDLSQSWAADVSPAPLLEYIRVSPTGPMIPLAFTPTTMGARFHLGLTYRSGIIDAAQALAIADTFYAQLTNLIGST